MEELIKKYNLNPKLIKYLKENILTSYEKNDLGHNLDHILYVIKRSLNFAKQVQGINYDMVFTIAAYHDIGHYIDAKNHEKISSEMLLADKNLREYFSEEEIITMSEAVYDHRASLDGDPRSIYGKIVSSADRNVNIDLPLQRTYAYRIDKHPDMDLEAIIEESRQHIINKFGSKGYATEKMYFDDSEYRQYLINISELANDKALFRERYIKVNKALVLEENIFKKVYEELKRQNPSYSLDELLYAIYEVVRNNESESFDIYRDLILKSIGIDELAYYTKDVNPALKKHVVENVFPEYEVNDKAHGIVHILEVIRRSFALNDTYKLGLDVNMIFAIAAYHDLGKHENHEIHEKIAASRFIADPVVKTFFTDEQITIIHDAIEDHRSSKEDEPRSTYGKLISSADRNTSINIVFIRSFFVAHERQPETNIESYLDFTIKRLSKKYSEENPENMFYEDQTYRLFIADMRALLKQESEFKNRYCEVNHITNRAARVCDEPGEVFYTKSLKKLL